MSDCPGTNYFVSDINIKRRIELLIKSAVYYLEKNQSMSEMSKCADISLCMREEKLRGERDNWITAYAHVHEERQIY